MGERVLLVEDDALIAEMYRVRLVQDGWDVEVADDGERGLRSALERPPAVVLLDFMLPRLNGLGILEQLRADPRTREVPTFIISNSSGMGGRIARARELGAVAWLTKSKVTPAQLAKRLVPYRAAGASDPA